MASTHTIPSGTRLGPYEIQSLIGRGGMGEVYRARDGRLGREVAIKVLPTSFAADADRVRRFEREARAAGQLNHPNVVAVHDVDLSTEVPYIVSELLHGIDLRKRIDEGPIPPRKAVAIGIQIAEGLAAAHAHGIAHRDLKPENVMLLGGDHVKILDFGLAKLVRGEPTPDSQATGALATQITATGAVLGTASYMAPEQIREQPTDERADIFSVGAILYEMVVGRRAFDGATPADRIAAILHEPAPEIPRAVEDAAPGLGTLVESCLEKNVEDRFQCAHDLAVALRQVEAAAAERRGDSGGGEGASALETHRPTFHRTTYREGTVLGARFAPDGHAICYGGSWEGRPVELFWTFPGNPESRALGYPQTDVLAISPSGEMAVSLRRHTLGGFIWSGMLARMPAGGGAPREILDGVYEADWSPDGRQLAIVREEAGFERIEFPIGKVLYKTPGWVSHMRVSPDGKHIAFIDHPHRGDDAGGPAWVGLEGNAKILSSDWSSARGLAWTPDGKEIVFTAFRSTGVARALYRTTLEGPERTVLEIPGHMTLQDISHQGAALIVLENERSRAQFFGRNNAPARDLTWLDWTLVRAISADGGKVLFDETGIGGGALHSVYIRNTDGS
ncbi:MAG: protein kinase domain-containing protein, partial [Bacteroidota bacterium]